MHKPIVQHETSEVIPVDKGRRSGKTRYRHFYKQYVCNKPEREDSNSMSVVKGVVDIALRFGMGSLFPTQKWLHVITGERWRFEEIHRKCDALLEKFIDEGVCRRRSNSGEEKSLLCDLLNLRCTIGSQESPFPINNVKAVLLDVSVAGTETSTSLLLYAILELLRNPEVLKTVQAEVRQVYKKQGYVSEEELELKFMKAVLKETMRLHPPVPLLFPRENSERCEINGHNTPENSSVCECLGHWERCHLLEKSRRILAREVLWNVRLIIKAPTLSSFLLEPEGEFAPECLLLSLMLTFLLIIFCSILTGNFLMERYS